MLVSDNLSVKNNHLMIGSHDTVELAEKYGTPLYVMDEALIRKNCRTYKQALDKYYGGNGLVLYASKAFCSMYMCKLAADEGMGIDVVSGGELFTALRAGFPTEKIFFHGNNKTADEIELAVENGIGHIICDNAYELDMIDRISKKHNINQKIMFRIKPGIDAHTHDYIRTGQIDSKFGVALENGEAFEIMEHASKLSNVTVDGVHCHIGSQIFDIEPFCDAASVMMKFISDVGKRYSIEIDYLNLGGGFGIAYTEKDDPISYDKYIEKVSETVKKSASELGIKIPSILMEPGRSIAAPAGITLYTVGGVKNIKNVRKYVSVDGGMGDNPRYILYGAEYTSVIANKAGDAADDKVTIAGKCCESGDLIAENVMLQKAEEGDILAVLATGAYNYSMASNYNRIPRPPVVMVNGDEEKVIVKRESYEDLIKNDVL